MEKTIIRLAETDSTNRYVSEECQISNDGLTVVVADFQTAGRGQGSNRWESRRGENLLFSMAFCPSHVAASRQFVLSMAVANALRRVLERYLGTAVEVKWPNDIYVGDGKISGTLIEARLAGNRMKACIVGIGLNVNQRRFFSDAPNPVSMAQVADRDFPLEEVLQSVVAAFEDIYENDDTDTVAAEYRQHLYRRKGFHAYRDAQGDFLAELAGVETDGHLVLRDRQGRIRRYGFKEVEFLTAGSSPLPPI